MQQDERTYFVKCIPRNKQHMFLRENKSLISTLIEINDLYICFVVTVDIEKAFDLLDHDFLCQAFFFKKSGFGRKLISCIETLIRKQESCIINLANTT